MKNGFTLLELMMSIMILSIMLLLSFICFHAVVSSWTAGLEMSDSMAQADYVMNQIESALRSAYFSTTVPKEMERGFAFNDDGEGEEAHDSLEWMKLGRAFVGMLRDVDGKTELAEIPHRVRLFVSEEGEDGNGEGGLMAKAWCNDFRDENETDEEREESIKAYLISSRVMAMDCKILGEPPNQDQDATEVEWKDEWSSSNALPYKVSVTLYLKPVKEGEDPVALTRDITIPVWKYSQNPGSADGRKSGRNRTDGGQSGKTGQTGQSGNSGKTGNSGKSGQPVQPGGNVRPGAGGMMPGAGSPMPGAGGPM